MAYPFAPVSRDTVGGAEQVLSLLDRGLCELGHRSIVVACEDSEVAGTLVSTPRANGSLTEPLCDHIRGVHQQNIERALAEFDVDIVHMHGIDFPQYLPPPGVPVLVTLHLPPAWYPEGIFRLGRPDTWLNCVSKRQLADCPESTLLIGEVENGVPVDQFSSSTEKDGFALGLGRICPEKNFHAAIDAAVLAKSPFILGGQVFPFEEHVEYFRAQIQPRLGPRQQFLGPVGFSRKRRLLGEARCVLQPSLCPETSSLAAMEAFACGTPVIGFASGALPDIVEHGVTGFIVRDVREMAEAIQAVHTIKPETCRQVAERRFSARRMVDDYLALYERLACNRSSRKSNGRPHIQVTPSASSHYECKVLRTSYAGLKWACPRPRHERGKTSLPSLSDPELVRGAEVSVPLPRRGYGADHASAHQHFR